MSFMTIILLENPDRTSGDTAFMSTSVSRGVCIVFSGLVFQLGGICMVKPDPSNSMNHSCCDHSEIVHGRVHPESMNMSPTSMLRYSRMVSNSL